MIVDTHLHAWLLDSPEYPWKPLAGVAPADEWPIEASIEVLDRFSINGGVLIQPSMYSFDHRYVIACGQRFPDRLRLVGMVDPRSPSLDADVAELADLGFRGLRIASMLRPELPWYSGEQADRLWRSAADKNLILCLLLTPQQMAEAGDAIARFPSVPIVVDHAARPDRMDGHIPRELFDAVRFGNVYVKLSAFGFMSRLPYPHADALEWMRMLFDAFGPDRLMWGTDTPMSQEPDGVGAALRMLSLALPDATPVDLAKIRGDTAAHLFGWR